MLRVRRLGTVPYDEAYALQRALSERARDDYLLVLEHPHVFTLGVRADPANVLGDPEALGADLVRTDRGGDVTYHGPGQLVVYPVLTVSDHLSAGRDHVHRLEQVVIDALGSLGVERVGRLEGYPGIWLDPGSAEPAKVAAVGVRTVRVGDGRRRTLHGVALNVDCDLSMFAQIVPCGISDRPVTSLAASGHALSMAETVDALVERAVAVWGASGVDDRAVTIPRRTGQPVALVSTPEERAPMRRLRQAGVDPSAGMPVAVRKPPWLRVPARMGDDFRSVKKTIGSLSLVTVCEEAGCPNIFECWNDGTATFMVNGSRCTRACGFCQVDTRHPLPLDPGEPDRVGQAVARMNLAHAVVTCVARDDLGDGGAGAIAATVDAIRRHRPGTTVETLISDCKGDGRSLELVFAARPDVLNHNIETVARLQRAVRPSAGYARSLAVLARAADAGLVVKSGLMVGLGESDDEVVATLADLASVGVRIATIGQYLRPSSAHLPVARWWSPEEFDALATAGRDVGLDHVESSPLTRSSYHARDAADAVRAKPERSLEVVPG
jgi:lipoic acid synthetase